MTDKPKRHWHHHEFEFSHTTEAEAVFHCGYCDRKIGFHLPDTKKLPTALALEDGTYAILPEHHLRGGAIDNTIGPCVNE